MSGEQNFWSRRRAAVAAEEQAEQASIEAAALAEEQTALEEKSDDEILAELNLPDPDTMQQGDDFSAFMAKAVPDRIRRRALRTLWRSNPVLANVDMLVDYGEDFTDAANVIENLQTTYQVGKGMLKHVQEMARQAEEKAEALARAAEDTEQDDAEDETELTDATVAENVAEDTVGDVEISEDNQTDMTMPEEEAFVQATPRRMVFRVEEQA